MIEKLVEKIICKQLDENTISKEDVNIYRYGYTLVFEVLINIIIAIIIGVISGKLYAIVLFLLIYIPLRSFCGGWHADKLWKCTIFSNLIIVIMLASDKYVIKIFTNSVLLILFAICLLVVFWLAPVDTKTKPISVEERKIYKKKISIILLIHLSLLMLMILLNCKKVIFVLMFSYVTQAVMLILGNVSKKIGVKNSTDST